jgi:hypothetical protein
LLAFDQQLEGNQSFGWVADVNDAKRYLAAADLSLLSTATDQATPDTLALRDVNADSSFNIVRATQLAASIGDLTIQAVNANKIRMYEGVTEIVQLSDESAISTLAFKGTSGGNLTTTTADPLYLSPGTGGKVVIRDGTTTYLESALSGNVGTLTGSGSSGTILKSTASDLSLSCGSAAAIKFLENDVNVAALSDVSNVSTLQFKGSSGGAIATDTASLSLASASGSYISLLEGTTEMVRLTDESNVSTLDFKGSSGAKIKTTTSALTLEVPSGSQLNVYEGTTQVCSIKDSGYGELNFTSGVGVISSQVVTLAASTYASMHSPFGRLAVYATPTETVIYSGASASTTTDSQPITHQWNGTGGSRKVEHRYSRIQTTDATVTTAWTSPSIATGVTVMIELDVVANTNGASSAVYKRLAGYRNSAGTVSLVGGGIATPLTGEDVAGWDCTLDISGTTVRCRITGAIATSINWEVHARMTYGAAYA